MKKLALIVLCLLVMGCATMSPEAKRNTEKAIDVAADVAIWVLVPPVP